MIAFSHLLKLMVREKLMSPRDILIFVHDWEMFALKIAMFVRENVPTMRETDVFMHELSALFNR